MTFKRELGRKAIHAASSVFPIAYWFLDKQVFLPFITILSVSAVLLDYGRHKVPWVRRAFSAIFGGVLRENEQAKLTGGATVMVAQVLMVAFFPKPIAIAALLILSIGDSAAALVGLAFGKHKIYHSKTWEGSLAFLISGTLVAALVPGIPLYAAAIAAAGAGAVEVFFSSVDDNIFIPLASGIILVILLGV